MDWAIETCNLFKSYEKVTAIRDLSLVVPEGSIFGLVGPNGAGKSTLIKMLTGIVRPDNGDAFILGRNIREKSGSIRQRVGYVPDVPVMYPSFSVGDMFRLGRRLYEGWEDHCRELSRALGLPTGQLVRQLSRGQKVGLVLALSLRPRLLILDEPTAGLDPVIRRGFLKMVIEEVAERGTTVFYSTHNLNDLEQSADYVSALYQGELLFSHSLDELKEFIHRVRVVFEGPISEEKIKGVSGLIDFQLKGRICTLTINSELETMQQELLQFAPVLVERVDFSLEDMFISLMKDRGYSYEMNRGTHQGTSWGSGEGTK